MYTLQSECRERRVPTCFCNVDSLGFGVYGLGPASAFLTWECTCWPQSCTEGLSPHPPSDGAAKTDAATCGAAQNITHSMYACMCQTLFWHASVRVHALSFWVSPLDRDECRALFLSLSLSPRVSLPVSHTVLTCEFESARALFVSLSLSLISLQVSHTCVRHKCVFFFFKKEKKLQVSHTLLVTSSVFSEDSKKVSKASASSNCSGNKKLRSAHSSWRLFCSGVPVSRRRAEVLNSRTTLESSESSFLMRWASSMTKYFHSIFLKVVFSRHAISKDVNTMSNLPGLICV